MSYADIIATAESVLSTSSTHPTNLVFADTVVDYPDAACIILRCTVVTASDALRGLPDTVILKRWNTHPAAMRHEWTALAFLDRISETSGMAPHLYGVDVDAGLLIIEDLGDPTDRLVGNILFGKDQAQATAALIALNRSLGRLHASTIGLESEFREFQRRQNVQATSRHRVYRLETCLAEFPEIARQIGMNVSPQAESDMVKALDIIRNPGPFLALTHGDVTPGNAFFHDGQVRWLDFETADFRHALLDGSFGRMRYLHSVWARSIPISIQRKIITEYRRELSRGCPEATDDTVFGSALIASSAAWMAGLCEELPAVMQQDRKWGRATSRQRIIAALEHFTVLAQELDNFLALAAVTDSIARALRYRWPETDCTLRPYDAYT